MADEDIRKAIKEQRPFILANIMGRFEPQVGLMDQETSLTATGFSGIHALSEKAVKGLGRRVAITLCDGGFTARVLGYLAMYGKSPEKAVREAIRLARETSIKRYRGDAEEQGQFPEPPKEDRDQWHLLGFGFLREMVKVRQKGNKKHGGEDTWKLFSRRVYLDAAQRHMARMFEGEDLDESGEPHAAHVAVNMMFYSALTKEKESSELSMKSELTESKVTFKRVCQECGLAAFVRDRAENSYCANCAGDPTPWTDLGCLCCEGAMVLSSAASKRFECPDCGLSAPRNWSNYLALQEEGQKR